ncbi:MAG: TPM domain-containing protein [Croceibacterium sp.]
MDFPAAAAARVWRIMLKRRSRAAGSDRSAQHGSAYRLDRPAGPVLDAANLLDPAEEQKLVDQLIQFHRRTGHALVVVTVQSLGGEDIADYTWDLFSRWGVGSAERNDGVVLLVAPNERQVRIATGYGMAKRVPDALVGQIIRDTIIPSFRSGDFAAGIADGADALIVAMSES